MPMSNIASLNETDRPAPPALLSNPRIGVVLASAMLTVLIVSLRPFHPESGATEGGGDIVNQLGFGAVGGLAILSILGFADRRRLSALLSPWWLILLALLALSVVNATDSGSAARSAVFTLIGMVTVAAILILPRDAEALSDVLIWAGGVTVALSYFGLLLLPNEAIHGAGGLEPQHAGFWRGVFSHKNIAGPVMACFSFVGLYLFRRGRRLAGALLLVSAFFFMANTGSKTTAGLVPLAVLLVGIPGLFGLRALTPLFVGLALIGAALGTVGTVYFAPLGELAATHMSDPTFTGRTALWEFSGEALLHRPWTGYGYESFWGTPLVTGQEKSFDQDWDIRGIVHGHNSYLDLAIAMGLPGLGAAVLALIVIPLSDYARVPHLRENIHLADLFMMIALFTLLGAFLESFFFRRVDPVWILLVMSVIGLRLVARFEIASGRRPGRTYRGS